MKRTPAGPRSRRRRLWIIGVPLCAVVLGLIALAFVPLETKQGIDYAVTSHTLPLYAKALDFLQRDSSYARLVPQIVSPDASPEARVLAIFDWTKAHVRDTPFGFPVVDDHVSHIIIRGYGEADQKADVFTTLTTYAGVPAYWSWVGGSAPYLVLSFVWLDGRWRVFDVENELVFRTASGALAAAEDLEADSEVVKSLSANRWYRSRPYQSYFDDFRLPTPPDLLRAELQMPWPRVSYTVKRLVGLGRREWQRQQ